MKAARLVSWMPSGTGIQYRDGTLHSNSSHTPRPCSEPQQLLYCTGNVVPMPNALPSLRHVTHLTLYVPLIEDSMQYQYMDMLGVSRPKSVLRYMSPRLCMVSRHFLYTGNGVSGPWRSLRLVMQSIWKVKALRPLAY